MPGAAAPQPRALRVAQRDEHRGAGRVAGRSADRAGAGHGLRATSITSRRRSSRTSSSRRGSRGRSAPCRASSARSAATSSSRSSAASRTTCRGWSTRSASATSARRRPRRSRGTSGRWTAILDAPVEALQTVPEIGPVVAASVRAFADEPHNRALVAKLAAAGVNMASQQPDRSSVAAGPAGRQDVRADRHAADDDARGGDGGHRAAGRQGRRARSARRRATWWPGRRPAASSRRPGTLGVPILTEEEFRALIMELGPGDADAMRRFTRRSPSSLTVRGGVPRRPDPRRRVHAGAGRVTGAAVAPTARGRGAARRRVRRRSPGVVNFADVAERINAAVVNIDATSKASRERDGAAAVPADARGSAAARSRRAAPGLRQRVHHRPRGLHPHEPPRHRRAPSASR